MKTHFTSEWKNWITTNVNAGQDLNGIFKILLDEGYDYSSIVKEMNYQPSQPASKLVNPFKANAINQNKQTQNNHQKTQNDVEKNFENNNGIGINKEQIFLPNATAVDHDNIDLRTIDNFLNQEECNKLITLIKSKLRPSEIADVEADSGYRTSRTCDLGRLNDKFIQNIDERICQLIGIDQAYSEVIQGQYYEVGQQFKKHTDYFEQNEFTTHCHELGQRTFTIMIYLNEVKKGGETCFVNIDEQFKPMTGTAVIWNSLNPDGTPNSNTMHQAKPVEQGYKAVITKWFRTQPATNARHIKMFTKDINQYVPNYTTDGIYKTKLPETLFRKIKDFYLQNRKNSEHEHVDGGFIYSNKKSSNKTTKSSSLINLSDGLRQEIHDQMKPLMENWCKKELEPTFVYGIREYHEGAILKLHRDRIDTHIISAILNVDQETNVDWPLLIEDNFYRKHQVMLKPGEMVFYEGARLLHGRPVAFKGASFANIFCHFKPTDYIARHQI